MRMSVSDELVVLDGQDGPTVLFATAELAPLVRIGGLADASAGLVTALRRAGVSVEVVVPDYDGSPGLVVHHTEPVAVPDWAGWAVARHGVVEGVGRVTAVSVEGIERPHPYNDPDTGWGWDDNDRRFMAYSAAVAGLARCHGADLVHLNDWHTAATVAWLDPGIGSVLTVHNMAYQGHCDPGWLSVLGPRAAAFGRHDACNPLAGGVALADRVVAVSPAYAIETRRAEGGAGLHDIVRSRGRHYLGIRNGIDVERWDPSTDPYLPAGYDASDLEGKAHCRAAVCELVGFDPADREPIVGFVGRFADQKGVDLALGLASRMEGLGARLVLVGRGDPALERAALSVAARFPDRVAYLQRTEEELVHLVMAGADLLLVPSRFEPCGLTPMEAMRCGTVPVVSPVGGLRNTVTDADTDATRGTGFVAPAADEVGLWLGLGRAIRAYRDRRRWAGIQRRGMSADWSWREPAERYLEVYRSVLGPAAPQEPSWRAGRTNAADAAPGRASLGADATVA